uniref:Histidine--tRNA ligase n=1 Tax=candidate division WOR-3 bacterium TaxID=2052148 RepID=A0A7C4CAA0_UNCW3
MKSRRPKGTLDFVPPESERLRQAEELFGRLCRLAGFEAVVLPTFEHTEVFVKSSGSGSDIVLKEMYSFQDRAGRDLTLRPEGTPGVVRAVLENGVRLPCRLYYTGSFFRYSQPQKGRYREFHQLGVEALGEASPRTDAEVIRLGGDFFSRLGIGDCRTVVNSIGCRDCRPAFRGLLVAFLRERRDKLCADCQLRLEQNPLRVFDCKNEKCRNAVVEAPVPRQHLCSGCAEHFAGVLAELEQSRMPFAVEDRLVRGLDYYNRTTFEYLSGALGAQDSLGGGGRYDYLIEEFGGPATPAVGFALGLERALLALPAAAATERRSLVFVVWLTEDDMAEAQRLTARLREAGIAARVDYDATRLKQQFRAADSARARCCIVVGGDELKREACAFKDLATGEQTEVRLGEVVERVRRLLAARSLLPAGGC